MTFWLSDLASKACFKGMGRHKKGLGISARKLGISAQWHGILLFYQEFDHKQNFLFKNCVALYVMKFSITFYLSTFNPHFVEKTSALIQQKIVFRKNYPIRVFL